MKAKISKESKCLFLDTESEEETKELKEFLDNYLSECPTKVIVPTWFPEKSNV